MILSNFNYCPLIWILCNKSANKQVNRANNRALMIVHNDYDTSFKSLLDHSNNFTIHGKSLEKLMIDLYKVLNNINPSILWELYGESVQRTILGQRALQNSRRKYIIIWSRVIIVQGKFPLEYP